VPEKSGHRLGKGFVRHIKPQKGFENARKGTEGRGPGHFSTTWSKSGSWPEGNRGRKPPKGNGLKNEIASRSKEGGGVCSKKQRGFNDETRAKKGRRRDCQLFWNANFQKKRVKQDTPQKGRKRK